MMTIGKVRLGESQKEYSDRLLSVLTFLLVLMMFVVAPLRPALTSNFARAARKPRN